MNLPGSPRIALVHDWLTVPGGAEEVLREIHDLFPGDVFCSQFDAKRFPWLDGARVTPTALQGLPGSLTRHAIYAPLMPAAYRQFDLRNYDLILTDSHSFAHQAVPARGALHIVYYHTPARSLWVPEIDDRASRTPIHKAIAARLKKLDLEASKHPDVLISNSQTTADRIKRFYGRDVSHVIYPPVNTAPWQSITPRGGDALITWGRLVPYKRVDLAIAAAMASETLLHVVGDGPQRPALEALASNSPWIRFHGRLSDDALHNLLGECRAAVFPGYEDFGIVPVEAMAAGIPVIAFDAGGAAETVPEGLGIRFAEQTADSLVDAIRRLDSLEVTSQALRNHASRFDRSVFRKQYSEAIAHAWAAHLETRNIESAPPAA